LNERRNGFGLIAEGFSTMYAGKLAASSGKTMRGTD
jgi:hypothetical protein